MKRPVLKIEVKQWWCGIRTRHRDTHRVITKVRTQSVVRLPDGTASHGYTAAEGYIVCAKCRKPLRKVTGWGAR
jgi:hypothetical protein